MMESIFYVVRLLFLKLCFSLLPVFLFSQDKVIDSLENKLKQATHDSSRWELFFHLSKVYYGYDTAKSAACLVKGYSIIKNMKNTFALARYYETKFSYAFNSSNFVAALTYIDSAIYLYESIIKSDQPPEKKQKATFAIAGCGSDKGIIYNKLGKNDKAVVYFLDYINALQSSDDPYKNKGIASANNNISSCYYDLKNFEKALQYDKAAIPYRILDKNEEMLAISYIFVSDDFDNMQQFDSALFYLDKAKPIMEKLKKNSLNVQYYDIVAQTYRLKGDYINAIASYQKTIEETRKINDGFQIMRCQKMLGICYAGLKNFVKARQFFLLALPAATEKNSPKERIEILGELVNIEEKTAHIDKAFLYMKQLTVIKDSLKNDEVNKTIAEIENKYQAAEKAKEIVQLNADKKIQSL
jgi:tetratricopeptide (TPR) repeat protein